LRHSAVAPNGGSSKDETSILQITPFWFGALVSVLLSPVTSIAQDPNIQRPVVETERLVTRARG